MEKIRNIDEFVHRLSNFFDTIGNAVRLQILLYLRKSPMCVSVIAEKLNRKRFTISRHLKILRDNGLVKSETRGKYRYYSLKRPDLIEETLEIYTLLTRADK